MLTVDYKERPNINNVKIKVVELIREYEECLIRWLIRWYDKKRRRKE